MHICSCRNSQSPLIRLIRIAPLQLLSRPPPRSGQAGSCGLGKLHFLQVQERMLAHRPWKKTQPSVWAGDAWDLSDLGQLRTPVLAELPWGGRLSSGWAGR